MKSGWINAEFGIEGDTIAAFIGKCDVLPEFMVDMEDLEQGAAIYSEEMLHFIIELINNDLERAVLNQRLFICIIKEVLEKLSYGIAICRTGDDLYINDSKLTISIATKSPASTLIHTGINVSSKNTPVKTKGLKDLGLAPSIIASLVMERYKEECFSVKRCLTKVKFVD